MLLLPPELRRGCDDRHGHIDTFVFEVLFDFSGCGGWFSVWCDLYYWLRLFASLMDILEFEMCNAMTFYAGLLDAQGLIYPIVVAFSSSGVERIPLRVHSGWHTVDCRRVSRYGPVEDNVARSSGRSKVSDSTAC